MNFRRLCPSDHKKLITAHCLCSVHCNNEAAMLQRPSLVNLLKPTCYMMHQQFNIQQLYALPTMYLRVLYLSQNKQLLVPLTA